MIQKSSPKISFVTFCTRQTGSTRLRVYTPCDELQKSGLAIGINDDWENSDIVVFQKSFPVSALKDAFIAAKRQGKFVCFDIDDYFLSYRYFIQHADCVFVSTPYLKETFSTLNANIHVVENPLDIDATDTPPKTFFNSPYKIGWFGYSPNSYVLKDFNIRNVIQISEKGDIIYNVDTIDDDLKQMDLIVIPQHKKPETLGKTHCRMLKALYLGIPVLVSDMPEYRRLAVQIGYDTDMIVPDGADWNDYINDILQKRDIAFDTATIREKILAFYGKDIVARHYYDTMVQAYHAHLTKPLWQRKLHTWLYSARFYLKPYKKVKKPNGGREFYVFGIKVYSYAKAVTQA